jgi:hypothetical protein
MYDTSRQILNYHPSHPIQVLFLVTRGNVIFKMADDLSARGWEEETHPRWLTMNVQ